ncbi:hypothetical protein M1D47_12585 [Bacillus sp. R1-10]
MDINLDFLDAILDKPIKGLPKYDQKGSKNADKITLLTSQGFVWKERRKVLVRNHEKLSFIDVNNFDFVDIVQIAKKN